MTAIIYFRETIRFNISQLKYYVVPILLTLYYIKLKAITAKYSRYVISQFFSRFCDTYTILFGRSNPIYLPICLSYC